VAAAAHVNDAGIGGRRYETRFPEERASLLKDAHWRLLGNLDSLASDFRKSKFSPIQAAKMGLGYFCEAVEKAYAGTRDARAWMLNGDTLEYVASRGWGSMLQSPEWLAMINQHPLPKELDNVFLLHSSMPFASVPFEESPKPAMFQCMEQGRTFQYKIDDDANLAKHPLDPFIVGRSFMKNACMAPIGIHAIAILGNKNARSESLSHLDDGWGVDGLADDAPTFYNLVSATANFIDLALWTDLFGEFVGGAKKMCLGILENEHGRVPEKLKFNVHAPKTPSSLYFPQGQWRMQEAVAGVLAEASPHMHEINIARAFIDVEGAKFLALHIFDKHHAPDLSFTPPRAGYTMRKELFKPHGIMLEHGGAVCEESPFHFIVIFSQDPARAQYMQIQTQ